MALSEGLLSVVRDWVGVAEPPTDLELNDFFDDSGSARAVVEKILRRRLAAFIASPASFGVGGRYNQNVTTNINTLRKMLEELSGMDDDLGWDEDEGVLTAVGLIGVQHLVRIGAKR